MGNPLRAYSLLDNIQGRDRLTNTASNYTLASDVADEAEKEARAREKREARGGIGRLIGGVAGMALTSLIPGGGLLAAALAASAGAGSSYAGQLIAGGTKKVKYGKFNIENDKATEKTYRDKVTSSVISDGVAAGILNYAKGIKELSALKADVAERAEKATRVLPSASSEIQKSAFDWNKWAGVKTEQPIQEFWNSKIY